MGTDFFEQRLVRAWNPRTWHDVRVVVAVSGGADSVALLRGLHRLAAPGQLMVAHYNHQLRGGESDEDEAFVRRLCDQLGVPCETGRAEAAVVSTGDGLEAAARAARYGFLRRASSLWGARYLVTAHTADDQAETILHRIVRGTGLSGLAGMPETRPLSELTAIRRPLLGFSRQLIVRYLQALGQPYREDSSNEQLALTRNWIRHELLPLLGRELNPQVSSALLRLGQLAREAQEVVDQVVDPLVDRALVSRRPAEVELCCQVLRGQHPYVVREVLMRVWILQRWPRQAMGGDKWRQLGELVGGEASAGAALTLPGPIQARLAASRLVLTRC